MYKRFKSEKEARAFIRKHPRAKLVSWPEWWCYWEPWLVYIPMNGSR